MAAIETPDQQVAPGVTVRRLLYVCVARKQMNSEELGELLEQSRANNARDAITGLLLYKEGLFTQLLEGPAEAVRQCFDRICRDSRHSGCIVIETSDAAARMFPDWRMGFRNLGDPAVAPPPGYSDFLNSTTAVDGTGQAGPYWRLLDYFRREM